nr:MAG TPA: hypothetical protein [Caudoviricetes sp.]
MQFVNLTDEQRKQIAAEQVSKNIQPMPMEKGLQTEILPFSLNPLKLFGGVASNAAADVAGADRDYRADISNAKNTDEIKSAVNNAISKFDNANPLIFGGDDLKKQKSEFLKNVSNSIRQSKLADGLSEYNGNLYLRKGDELFDLDDGLIKQIGRVMRDNVGSMAGAALGYKKGGGFFQNMAGSALGAAGGSSIDHLNNSNYAGQEANAANALKKMGEEALFSVAGDALIGAAAKYGKPTLNLAGKVADKMPLLNLGKQAVESVPTANVKGAMKSAEAIAGDEAEAMLKNAAEVGGYKVDGGNITDLQLLNPIINKAKDFSARAAQKLRLDDAAAAINNTRGLDAEREKILNLALSDRKSAERLLNALRGDKSGRGARNLADLAQSDVSRLREIIGQSETTDLKDVVEQYYKATKDDFGQAIDNLDAFKNGQKIRLSDDAIEQMKDEVSSNLNIFDKSSDKTRGVMEGFDSLKGRELGVKELNELRANYNKGLNDILNSDKNSYATKINFIKGKEILERAMDDLLGDDAARAYLRENLQKYKDFKGFERSPLFKAITNIESSAQDVMNAFRGLRDAQGGLYDKFISKLSPEQAQKFELAAIKDDFEGALGKTGTFNVREILNGKELNDALKKTNFRSEKAKEIVREIDKLAKARGNLAEIFAALDSKFIMPTRFNKGIATTFEGASKTAFVNAVRQTALKYVPIIGNDAALEYHLREAAKAIKSGGTLKDYVKTMEKNGASKEQAKAFTDFIKEAAEQGSKLEQAGAKQEVVKGDGWTMRDGGAAKQYARHKFEVEKWINDLSGVLSDEWAANLKTLALKHPEMFKSEADVFHVIKEIKDNPTHFFKNNNDRNALLVKNLKEGKSGEIAVRKKDGQIVHATINNEKRLDRLQKRNKENLGNGELSKVEYSDGARRLPRHSDQSRTMPTAKAESVADDAGIIQTFIQPGSKSQGELGLPTKRIIPQNSAKDELKSLSKEYDVEQFLKDREDILAKDARYGKTRFSESRVEDNGGVGGWEYKRTPAGYDKNYNADFLITKADVAKIRGGKIDEQTLGKLKQDLESSEYLGYEYKKTHKNNGADEYADEEFFKGAPVESKGGHSAAAAIEEQRFAGTGRDKNTIMYANPHVGTGLAGGTLNAKDENGNFDAEKFAKGFIYGLFGSKVTAATLKKTNPKLYDQIVNIGKDKAGKEKISSFVNKLKQDELGKLLQKTITNKDLSTKTKIEIIEAAKKRFTKETPKSLNGQSEAQMSESALKAKENNLKIDDVSNDAKEKWIKTFGLKSIDDDFIPNLKPEVKKAIKDKEIRLTKGSLLKIVARGREKYIPLIKQSLEDTDMVLKDEGTFLFVKEMDDKSLVFTSVGRNFDTHITIISNAPKKINNIKNKLMNKAEVVYRSSKLRTTPL